MNRGRKQKLKDGWEWDWTGKNRHIHSWWAGMGRRIKRKMNKRARQEAKRECDERSET